MNYININHSFLIFILMVFFLYIFNEKSFSKFQTFIISLLFSVFFTYIFSELKINDSNDYKEYESKYLMNKDINLVRFEFGYVYLMELYKRFNISFSNFYLSIIFFCNTILIFYTNLILRNIGVRNFGIFPLMYYSALFINFNFIILRTFIACSLIIAMVYYISIKDFKQYFFLILAVSFHYLTIPIIFIVYLAKYITFHKIYLFTNVKYSIITLILILISLYNYNIIAATYIKYIDIYIHRLRPYTSDLGGWFGGYKNLPTTQIVMFIISLYIGRFYKMTILSIDIRLLLNISMLSFLIIVFLPFPKINSRIYLYYLPIYFILIGVFSRIFNSFWPVFIFLISLIYYLSNYAR